MRVGAPTVAEQGSAIRAMYNLMHIGLLVLLGVVAPPRWKHVFEVSAVSNSASVYLQERVPGSPWTGTGVYSMSTLWA
ncbi:hypothetical protein BH23GEM6_BH23GEM6_09960 [soil metagenome]